MKNFEELVERLIDEQTFLKDMQKQIVENYDIMLGNQQHNANNQEAVINNQLIIIKNQEIIVNNQINIVRNQKKIVQNQIQLDVILQTQAHILNLVTNLSGNKMSLEETTGFIDGLISSKQKEVLDKKLEEPSSL